MNLSNKLLGFLTATLFACAIASVGCGNGSGGGSGSPTKATPGATPTPIIITMIDDATQQPGIWTNALKTAYFDAIEQNQIPALASLWVPAGIMLVQGARGDMNKRGYRLVIVDDDSSDSQCGSPNPGCHTTDDFGPIAYVSVVNTMAAHVPISEVIGHEIDEMIGDPNADVTVFDTLIGKTILRELVDPVVCPYKIFTVDGMDVPLNDFVTPSWFNEPCPNCAAGQLDWFGPVYDSTIGVVISQPFQTCSSGVPPNE